MPIQQRKALIDGDDKEIPVSKQCAMAGISKSTLYYKPVGISKRKSDIMRCIDQLHASDPTLGSRRMCVELQNKGYDIDRSYTRKLMRLMRIKTIYCQPRTTTADPVAYKYPYLLRGLTIERPNQVWAIDITYMPMRRGYMYLVAIIDVKSRYIVGWSVSNTMDSSWVVQTVKCAVKRYGAPEIINSDQGSQFTSEEYVSYIKSLEKTRISMDGKGRALDNVYIERFWRSIKYEKVYLTPPETGHELLALCQEYIQYYNERRLHSSLDYLTPEKFYKSIA